MTVSDPQAAAYEERFLDMLDAAFRGYGVHGGLPPRFRAAVAATPRQRFVHRFRLADGPLRDSDADPGQDLAVIYSDAVMGHVDAAGEPLPSSNSQPSYILYLLHLLEPGPGQTVLEIGSGSGWLAAVMARLIGPAGRVVGVELIPELAAQSRADLAALDVANVQIVTGDGTRGNAAGAPYDRAIITAATWDVPAPLLQQVADRGLVLVPIERRSGDGCDVTLLRRHGDFLVAEQAVRGWFVPLLGSGQDRAAMAPHGLPGDAATERFPLPLGRPEESGRAPAATRFRDFLSRTEPDFVTKAGSGEDLPVSAFGLADRVSGSVALWQAGEVVSYGDHRAASRLARVHAGWMALGCPGAEAFRLEIHRAGAAPPDTAPPDTTPLDTTPLGNDRPWIEPRGSTTLVWQLRSDNGSGAI